MPEQDNNDKKKGSNIGCLIVVILFVIGSIAYGIYSTPYEEFSEFGACIMGVVGLVVAFFILKHFGVIKTSKDEDDSGGEKNGCSFKTILIVLGILLFFGIMANLFSASTEINHTVGIVVLVALAVGIGILFYSMKD